MKFLPTFLSVLLFLNYFPVFTISSRAPDVAPVYPDGWCDARYGRPTATTGECICLSQNCEGKGCQRSQGFVWYVYKDCPTCKCIAKERDPNEPVLTPEQRSEMRKTREANRKESIRSQTEQALKEEAEIRKTMMESDSADSPGSLSEWLEDYGRYLFGGVISLIFAGVILAQVSYSIPSGNAVKQPSSTTSSSSSTTSSSSSSSTSSSTSSSKTQQPSSKDD